MNERKRTLAAIAIILGAVALVVIGIGVLVTKGSIVSPVPQTENSSPIKIIFLTPTPTLVPIVSSTPVPTPK